MALPDKLKIVEGTRIILADATDWPSGGSDGWGNDTDQLDLTGVAAGEARQSAKFDFGVNRAPRYAVHALLESNSTTAPGSGEVYDFYLGLSDNATAATANPGGLSGSDADYTGTTNDSLDDSLKQLDHIGSLIAVSEEGEGGTPAGIVQYQLIGIIPAPHLRYGIIVVDNNTAQALEANAVEMAVIIIPLEEEIQD